MTRTIKILFLAASPRDTGQLELGKEMREIETSILLAPHRSSFHLVSQWAVRITDLQRILLQHQPQIIHFSGHGSKRRQITLEDDAGNSTEVSTNALCDLLRILKDNVRMVFLNACHVKDQAERLVATVDFAIGMNREITDRAAITFASKFYQGLAFNRSVREAFELGISQLKLENMNDCVVPELCVARRIDDSVPSIASLGSDLASSETPRQGEIHRAVLMAQRALGVLEEQAAGYGKLSIPVHLQIELEDKRQELELLERRLGER